MSAADVTPIWQPDAAAIEQATVTRYARWVERRHGLQLDDYDALWAWSVRDPDAFWSSIWEYFAVDGDGDPATAIGRREMPGAEWFPGTRLNYAERLFAGHDDDAVAIVHAAEDRAPAEIRWGELRAAVAAVADGLRALGVGPGDRVVGYLPNVPETIVAFLAAASVGAVWSCCSPDFGVGSVADRFAQIEPKLLIAVDGYRYGGRTIDRREVLASLQRRIPSLEATVVVPGLAAEPDLSGLTDALPWAALRERDAPAAPTFERVPFDHPLWILYSSGTTGLPKAIVQGHGGILLEHLKTHHLHLDLRAGDRFLWFTTTGWMVWNLLVSGLLTEAAIVLYDGSPGHPDMGVLWDLAERAGVTCFGASATYLSACAKAGVEPRAGRDLSRLRAVGSTGSPLTRDGFDWVYDHLGPDLWLFSSSGGTDVCTAFIGGVPTLPVHRGELQARALGVDLHAFDEDGRAVVGEVGELVITAPMPSMPLRFWGDDAQGTRYRESYFAVYPGVWRHGDWIEITPRGTGIISGRSDSTINRSGIRMGTSEIYRAVLTLPEVLDALVVDLPREGTPGWMPLFVVLAPGAELDDRLRGEIARRVREECSPRHVPDEIRAVPSVPRTLSGKSLELPVKRILMGTPVAQAASRDALADPSALDAFVAFADELAAATSG